MNRQLTLGMCSVTLRAGSVAQVVDAARQAGIEGIEWGSDIHVADTEAAATARRLSAQAGIDVLSLGSYFRAGGGGEFAPTVEVAAALGAPRIRVWAGERGSATASAAYRRDVAHDLRRAADAAAGTEQEVALEFHGGTLTDTAESALDVLNDVNRDNVGLYWQPPVDMPEADALASLETVSPHLVGIHCFSWWPGTNRLPLAGREQLWAAVIGKTKSRRLDVMLEFVEGDSPQRLISDAAWLRDLMDDGV